MKNKGIVVGSISVLIITILILFGYNYNKRIEQEKLENERLIKEKIADISSHYNTYVKTNDTADLYIYENDEYIKSGRIGKDVEISLEQLEINSDTEYFPISGFDESYFIKYDMVSPIEALSSDDKRYKKYLLFNENVETTDITKFYKDEQLVYELNQKFSLPIIIKDNEKIYVEYQDKLMYVLYDEIDQIVPHTNNDQETAKEITTIVYHFIYNPDIDTCDQIICHTTNQVQSHIDYLKNENYLTLKMNEFEMFIDGKINLPKNSIMITIDDGWFGNTASEIFTKNEVNATLFLITSAYEAKYYVSDYLEIHSHGDNIHTQGVCPEGQGGAIRCADRNMLLEDLKASREKTYNSIAFCYPFYEYNDYAISIVKEAGFTMAFGGQYAGGHYKMPVGGNKYKIPRFTMLNDTTVEGLKEILNNY